MIARLLAEGYITCGMYPNDGAHSKTGNSPVFLFFIPQLKPRRLEAFTDGQRDDLLQGRYVIVTLLQIIIWNAWTNMMNVMQAYVTCDPL